MRRGHLSDFFSGVVVKALSSVETQPAVSHQHEFNGSAPLRDLLGTDDRRNIPSRFVWFGDGYETRSADGWLSWYDARRAHPSRTEYRLYYPENEVTGLMKPEDLFFMATLRDGSALVVITPSGTTIQNQLLWLFGLDAPSGDQFAFQDVARGPGAELGFAAKLILEELGIEVTEPEVDLLDTLLEPFGFKFPSTRVFSRLARESLPDVSVLEDPDHAIVEWMEREEQLFRRLERKIVSVRLADGFLAGGNDPVDSFLSFSLSVQNRRKARAGSALENHLEELFSKFGMTFSRGAETENRNKPDFLFPGQAQYRDPAYPAARLTMLGAKSTLKDRWRQVLSEAVRIDDKHLLTLEPGVSENQTDEMRTKRLQLVVPLSIQKTYKPAQQAWLLGVGDFVKLVRSRERARP